MACQSHWSSAINSGLALSSRAPRGGRGKRAVELELLLIYLKYWPDLHYWNISIRYWGKEMPEPTPAGKWRKGNRAVKWVQISHCFIETMVLGQAGGGKWQEGLSTTDGWTTGQWPADQEPQGAQCSDAQHLWDMTLLYLVGLKCSLSRFVHFYQYNDSCVCEGRRREQQVMLL